MKMHRYKSVIYFCLFYFMFYIKIQLNFTNTFFLLFFSSFMTVYVGFLIFCTIIDLTDHKTTENSKSDTLQNLARFSLWKNAKKLFSTKVQDNNLPFLHGIRVLSTAWIVLFHEYFFQFFMINVNLVYIPEVGFFKDFHFIKKLIFFKNIKVKKNSSF